MVIERICLECNLPRKLTKNKVKTVCNCESNPVSIAARQATTHTSALKTRSPEKLSNKKAEARSSTKFGEIQ